MEVEEYIQRRDRRQSILMLGRTILFIPDTVLKTGQREEANIKLVRQKRSLVGGGAIYIDALDLDTVDYDTLLLTALSDVTQFSIVDVLRDHAIILKTSIYKMYKVFIKRGCPTLSQKVLYPSPQ
jgi:hypothetical protein